MTNTRILVLALPSAAILAALVWHSLAAMPRRRALLFWSLVTAFGILRGLGVRAVTEAIGAAFPYEIRNPLFSVGGVSAQEVVGWAVVTYLAWWVGDRFSRRSRRPSLFLAVAWASLFLGAIAWAVEAAAIAARWWYWTVPTASRLFLNVPAIGIVDWFFVGIDFLLPFVALTAPSSGRSERTWWRYLTLLCFPAHFAGHLLPGLWLHAVHWCLVLLAAALALRADGEDRPFTEARSWVPHAAFAAMIADIALVDVFLVSRPSLLQSVLPAVTAWLSAVHPGAAAAAAVAAALAAVRLPSLAVAALVAAGGALLLRLQARRITVVPLLALALFAFAFHRATAAARTDLTARLDRAIEARDRGDLESALVQLDAIARDHPVTHVPLAMAGEIDYRRNSLETAYGRLARAVEIKQDFVRGYRLLAAIDLQRGRRAEAGEWARRGLEVAPGDIQLRFLAGEDVTSSIDSAATAAGMAALAFEVGELAKAQRFVEDALTRWPADGRLRRTALRLGVAVVDHPAVHVIPEVRAETGGDVARP